MKNDIHTMVRWYLLVAIMDRVIEVKVENEIDRPILPGVDETMWRTVMAAAEVEREFVT